MKLPMFKAIIKSEEDVMDFMGFVEVPAHGKTMHFFNKVAEKPKYKFEDSKQLVTGVAISVNQPIYRRDDSGEYNMYFDKRTTRELGRRLLQHNFGGNVNINHDHSKLIKSARVDEIFYIDKKRGVEAPNEFKNQNLQDGSMLITYHIADKKEYEELKSMNLQGFSIEVFIDVERTNFEKANQKTNIKMSEKNKSLFERIKAVFQEEEENEKQFAEAVTTDGATIKWEGDLANGTVVYLVGEGEEDILAPEGTHMISENEKQLIVVIGADGVVESIEEAEAEEMQADETAEAVEFMASKIKELEEKLSVEKERNDANEKRFSNIEALIDGKKNVKPANKKNSVSFASKIKK